MEEIDFGSWQPSRGAPATLGEVYDSSLDAQRKFQNVNAYTRNLMDAYDRVNDEVKKSLGADLINPFNRYRAQPGDAMGAPGGSVYDPEALAPDPVKQWEADLDDLAGKHPTALDWAALKSRPLSEVAKLMKASEDKQSDVSQRRGFIDPKDIPVVGKMPWVGPVVGPIVGGAANIVKDPAGMAASFAGSLRGSLESPVDLLANVVGGVAGSASKSLVKNAIRNGLANAGVQSVLEPVVQANRAAGGLEYGWEKAFEDIAGAFGTGAALDLAFRPAGRAAIKRFGTDTPDGTFSRNTSRGGILFDAPEQLPIPAARPKTPDLPAELIERARNDDVAALREIAEKTGIIDQPAVKGALDYAELGGKVDEAAIQRFKEMGVDTGEGMRTLATVMKDPDRFTRMPEPIRQADAPLMREEAQALLTAQTEKVAALVDGLGPQLGQVVARALEAGLPQIVPMVREALASNVHSANALSTKKNALEIIERRMLKSNKEWEFLSNYKQNKKQIELKYKSREAYERAIERLSIDTGDADRAAKLRVEIEDLEKAQTNILSDDAIARLAAQIGDGVALADAVTVHTSNNMLEVTDALRRSPQAMDSNVPVSTDFMRTARDLAALEADAYDLVRSGEVAPAVGAEVANRVMPEHQARVLADLRKAGAGTLAQARAVIDDLIPSDRRPDDMPLSGGSRIDDPAGPEAKAQTERLREEHADALKEAQAPIKERDKVEAEVETIRGEIAKLEEKAAKTTFDDVGDTFDAPAAERFVDPFDQAPMPKADVDAIVDMWRYVREQNAIADPVSLTEFVRSKGGLKEDAGELKNMLGNYNKRPGLVSKKGMFLDDMTLDAWEAGYLPGTERPEIKTLLDALDNDLRGERVYSDLDADTVANKAAAVEMLRDLEEMGIRDARSEAAVRKHFEGEGDGGTQGGQGAAKEAGIFAELAAKRDELRTAETRLAELNNDLIPGAYSPMFAFIAERVEMQRAMDVRTSVNDALRLADTILPENARVTVTSDRLRADGVELDAMESRGDITLSLHALDPVARMGHEGVHTLVTRGLLKPSEVDLLAQAGREMKVFTPEIEAKYRKAYEGSATLERQISEEAAAHFVEARIKSPTPEVQTIADRVRALIQRVKNALNGYGFNTADDVRSAILRGDVARRQAQQQWMRSNDVTAMASDDQIMAAFAGERAKTADPVKLGRAKTMDAAGLSRDAIWSETGWFKGVDGKWRFEIDDSGATLGKAKGRLSRVLQNGEVYVAYPEIGRVPVTRLRGLLSLLSGGGYREPLPKWFGLSRDNGALYYSTMYEGDKLREMLVHETQHAIQGIEDHARGGNTRTAADLLTPEGRAKLEGELFDKARKRAENWNPNQLAKSSKLVEEFTAKYNERLAEFRRYTPSEQELHALAYEKLAGEVEARSIQKRLAMTPEQRAARPPWLDYDVPEDQQIVRFADGKHVSQMSYSSEPPVSGFPTLRNTTMYAIKAFHGSPHDFDKFSIDKIGTGEGAQAYGHGLYFADNPRVAQTYRENLSQRQVAVQFDPRGPVEASLRRYVDLAASSEGAGVGDVRALVDYAVTSGRISAESRTAFDAMVADGRLKMETAVGRLYEVRIDAEPEQFLDWDKPLSQQSEQVRAAALNIRNTAARAEYEKRGFPETLIQEYLGNASKADKTGGQLVQGMKGADQSADFSRQLRDAGIVGIRYLDQGSRSDGVGTYNYVVFDDALIEITAKDGVPMSAKDKSDVMFALRDSGRQDSLGYTSRALDAARGLKQAKGTPEQMLAQLKAAGVRQAELDATGLTEFLSLPDLTDTVEMYHGTSNDGARGISDDGVVRGPAFFSDRRTNAADYGGDQVLAVRVRKADLQIDADLPGARLLTVEDANGYFGNDGWTINDYLNAGKYSFGVAKDVPISGPPKKSITRDAIVQHLEDAVKRSVLDEGQPMFAIRSLDPSPEARKARAEGMGFDTSKVWYHGTRKEFEAFSLGAARNKDEVGIFLTQDARVASAYAGYYEDLMPGGYKAHEDESGTVLPLYLKKSMRVKTVDFDGGKYGRGDAIKSATSEGYDAVLLKNHYDAGGVQDQLVVFDPKNIRSVNAMFDPEKSDSPNLMFAIREGGNAERIRAYHWTDQQFDRFDASKTHEAGFHFGSMSQATVRSAVKAGLPWPIRGRMIPVEIEAGKVLNLPVDLPFWSGRALAKQLVELGVMPQDVADKLGKLDLPQSNAYVREWLTAQGYDAIRYPNRFEGDGFSYMTLGTGNVRHARTGDVMFGLRDSEPPKPPLHAEVAMLDRMNTLKDLAMACKG